MFLAPLSCFSQVQKARPRGPTSDLSLKMLLAPTIGLLLRVVYGLARSHWIIAAANSVGPALSGSVLAFKIRDLR